MHVALVNNPLAAATIQDWPQSHAEPLQGHLPQPSTQ